MVAYTKKPYRSFKKKISTNNPVKRAINKYKKAPPKQPKYQVTNNKSAIMTLSRQVKRLQMSQIGPYQKRMENVRMDNAHVGSGGFSRDRPIAFQVNDFTADCYLHSVNDVTKDGMKLSRKFEATPTYFTASDGKYNPLWAMNDCEVSTLRYLPIKAQYTFNLSQKMMVTEQPRWFRVDFLTPKKHIPTSDAHSLNLPDGLYSMSRLMSDAQTEAKPLDNKINYTYWRSVHRTKWMKFTPQLSTTDVYITRKFDVTLNFPNKVINVETDTPYSYVEDTILTNTPRNQAIWAVISTDRQYDVEDNLKINISRTIHWRDEHGAAN